jgi:YesN/AraC family two-component response regulator
MRREGVVYNLNCRHQICIRGNDNEEVFNAHHHLSKDLGIDELADYLHISASYFSKVFQKYTGDIPSEFRVKQKRVGGV